VRRAYSRYIASSLVIDPPRGAQPLPGPPFRGLAATRKVGTRSAASDAALFTLGLYSAQLLIFIAGIVQKGLLGPTGSGYWALMGTFMTFFGFAALGAFDGGAARQVPSHRGRGEYREAADVADTAGTFTMVAMAVCGVGLALVAVAVGGEWAPEVQWGLVILGLTAPLRALADCHDFLIQATKRFDASAAGLLLRAFITVTIQTAFVYFFGFWGMFLGLLLGSVAVLWMWGRLGLTGLHTPAFRWRIRPAALREVLGIGLPIMIQGQSWQLFLAIDNLIVAAFINVTNLGYYALAVSVTSYVLFLPRGIGTALFPRMLERFAPSGDIRTIRHYITDVQRILSYLLLGPAIASLYFLLPVLIRQALPAFTPAIPVIHVMVAGSFFISMVQMPTKVLIAANYRWRVAFLQIGSVVVNAGANYLAVAVLDGGIRGAAIATSASYAVLFFVVTGYALSKAFKPREVLVHLGEVLAVFVYLVAVMWGIEALLGPGGGSLLHDAAVGIGELMLCLALLSPWAWLAERRYGALTTIKGMLGRGIRRLRNRRTPGKSAGEAQE
jgi:O-antigen/teichoic acid export membrane protein